MSRVLYAIFVLVIALAGTSCSSKGKAQLPPTSTDNKPKAASKIPEDTKRRTDEEKYRLIGQVSSQDRILLSFKVAANIQKINVRPGVSVKKGQVLAQLEESTYKLMADAAKLQLERADNVLAQALRDFKIEEDLRSKDISSVAQFQNGELAYKNAVVAQKLAKVEMARASDNLSFTRLLAPVDGTISQQFKFVGDLSTGGNSGGATFEMFGLGDPEIYMNAPESLLTKLAVGARLDVNFPAVGLELPAKIVRIVPVIKESDRSFLVIAKLIAPNPRIVPGLFAEGLVKETRK